jgi:5S rRNA maturation endonuclease (ribonuclease M5)
MGAAGYKKRLSIAQAIAILADRALIHIQIMLDFDAGGRKIRRTFDQTQGCRHEEGSL